jgi:hypothetical protein
MNKQRYLVLFAIIAVGLLVLVQTVNAQSVPPKCHWDAGMRKVVCTDSGGNQGGTVTPVGGNATPVGGGSNGCVPARNPSTNAVILHTIDVYVPYTGIISNGWYVSQGIPIGTPICKVEGWFADSCGTKVRLFSGGVSNLHPCPQAQVTPPPIPPATNPCNISASWTGSGFSASCNSGWECTAAVPLPPTYIDVRPYPVTLVRWPTAIRCSGQGTSNGSCLVSDAGQMRNLRLTLEFRPATGVVTVTLPYLPTFTFNATSPTAQPVLFKWEVPSHPATGANILAGSLGGFFDEIPADFPVFAGQMTTPYRLYWTVSFERDENGTWVGYSFNGELLPQDVRDLPSSMIADLNGDGTGDAYWDSNFVISRMDDNNRTDNPLYARSWSYGSLLPWASREGQAQIGWPGLP